MEWNGVTYTSVLRLLQYLFPKETLVVTCLQYKSFENSVGTGEIARNEQILLFPHCLYLFREISACIIEVKIIVCTLFQLGRV